MSGERLTVPDGRRPQVGVTDPGGPDDGIVQIRRGKYNDRWYLWGRVSDPSSKLNRGWELQFQVTDPRCDGGTKIKHINRTTYTAAVRPDSSCSYIARVVKTSNGHTLGFASYQP